MRNNIGIITSSELRIPRILVQQGKRYFESYVEIVSLLLLVNSFFTLGYKLTVDTIHNKIRKSI